MLYLKVVIILFNYRINSLAFGYWTAGIQTEATNALLPQKACQIAAAHDSYVYIIYTGVERNNSAFALEINLLKCMATLPTHIMELRSVTKEREHTYNSFSLFVLSARPEESTAYVRRITNIMNEKQKRKHVHKYIFLWRDASLEQLRELLSAVWQRKILNAIVITGERHIYTFEPYAEPGFIIKRITDNRYFYDKLRNLHKQQLRITMFKDFLRAIPMSRAELGYTGVDGLFAGNVAAYLNATANYTQPADNENYGSCLPNGSFTGVLRDLISGTADVSFNARFTLPCAAAHVEMLYPYFKRKLYLVVPAAKMQPEYLIFIKAFTCTLWLLLSLNFFAVTAIFVLLNRWAERLPHAVKMKHGRWYEVFEMFVKTHLGEPVAGFSRISSLRQYLIAWICFSYILTTIYFGKLESSFVHPEYEAELDSLDELHKLDVPIFGVHSLFTTVQSALSVAHWGEIEKRAVSLPLYFSSFLFAVPVSVRRDWRAAFVLRGETAKDFLIKTYDVERRRPRFHVVKEYLRSMPQEYILQKGSPFRYKFQQYQARIFESGLLEHWSIKDLYYTGGTTSHEVEEFYEDLPSDTDFDLTEFTDNEGVGADRKKKRIVLNLDILQGAFWLWCFGIVFSVIGFGVEYTYWWYGKKSVKIIV
ncbi:uncharacterized protein LOC110118208 [Ceratitis capitata]|uniref:uncharacterized protein LOC110118208 n=1 Tax=Ceratitis capitata TaxID=7213 RepID=UPI000A11AB5B|nr:uncharacterized protein LOC110118208 [Ceratitis capitata]